MSARQLTWLERDSFLLGRLYVEVTSGTTLEFAGIVSASMARRLSMPYPEGLQAIGDEDPVMVFVQVEPPEPPGDPRVRELARHDHPELWFSSEIDWRGPYRAVFELVADRLIDQ